MFSQKISSFVGYRSGSYEIESELRVRKLLESHTSLKFEFTRNVDRYNYDIIVARYDISKNDWTKMQVGFIEVEESPDWNNSIYPPHWRSYSYLARKVFEFDFQRGHFTDRLKESANQTIYLKVAADLSDAHCSLVSNIAIGEWTQGSDSQLSTYNDSYIRFPMSSTYVIRGVENCINFITAFFSRELYF